MNKLINTINKYSQCLVYIFAIGVAGLNFSLINDHVVWGDEAYSVNIIRGTIPEILQVVYWTDSHPPLYYIWLKLVTTVFGNALWAYHLASMIPFTVGLILAVTVLRKRFGNLASIAFVILSGLAMPCCEYNQEIRMYALVFMSILICTIMSYQLLGEEGRENHKLSRWIVLVLFGVIAAYSHYYGLVTTGILLFMTGLVYFIKNKGRTWAYGVCSIVAYLVLYSPWMIVLAKQMGDVKNGWWTDTVDPLPRIFSVIFCGARIQWILFVVILGLFAFVIITESGMFKVKRQRSTAFYAMITFLGTQGLVLSFAYVVSMLLNPILQVRYMYPLVPLTIMNFMIGIYRLVSYKDISKYFVTALLAILLVLGLLDFKDYRSTVKVQESVTKETLAIIGEPEEGTVFMSTGVQHLSYTILQYYYPGFEVLGVSGGYTEDVDDDVCTNLWRFSHVEESEETIQHMKDRGYTCTPLGIGHLGKYTFYWYHYVKE